MKRKKLNSSSSFSVIFLLTSISLSTGGLCRSSGPSVCKSSCATFFYFILHGALYPRRRLLWVNYTRWSLVKRSDGLFKLAANPFARRCEHDVYTSNITTSHKLNMNGRPLYAFQMRERELENRFLDSSSSFNPLMGVGKMINTCTCVPGV